jgi:myo-inositol-1-phosphate synthase
MVRKAGSAKAFAVRAASPEAVGFVNAEPVQISAAAMAEKLASKDQTLA